MIYTFITRDKQFEREHKGDLAARRWAHLSSDMIRVECNGRVVWRRPLSNAEMQVLDRKSKRQ